MDITIGQYIAGKSILHRLDPRVKIILMLVYIIALFMLKSPVPYALLALFTVLLIAVSKLPPRVVLRSVRPMLFLLIFTFLLNLLMTPGKTVLVKIPLFVFSLTITREALATAFLMLARLVFLIIGTSFITLTTTPMSLTDGVDALIKPLSHIGVPTHEISMMMTIAMRFIPTLMEETDKIMKAQTARGADFEGGNLIKRAKAMIPLLVPLFISAFRRADELAVAMDSRCYRGGESRTRMKTLKAGRSDAAAAAVTVLFFAAMLFVEYAL